MPTPARQRTVVATVDGKTSVHRIPKDRQPAAPIRYRPPQTNRKAPRKER